MQIKGTFLNGKVAKRIAAILFLAAFIPTLLMTFLTHRSIHALVVENAHKSLVDISRNSALSVFSNLLYARKSLEQMDALLVNKTLSPLQALNKLNETMFLSTTLMDGAGQLLDQSINQQTQLGNHQLKQLKDIVLRSQLFKTQLLVLPASHQNRSPVLALALPQLKNGAVNRVLIAELNPVFVWGEVSDYPAEISVCAYRLNVAKQQQLFCSATSNLPPQSASAPENSGGWELFLRAEFDENAWLFEAKRLETVHSSQQGSYIDSKVYIGVAIASFLLVGLLSLIQIRRTMGPLEQLIAGTRKIADGDYKPVAVEDESEFSELADSFNHMANSIQKQVTTLQTLSQIDQEMASHLNVENIIHKVITRTQQIVPNATVFVGQFIEITEQASHVILYCSNNHTLASPHVTLSGSVVKTIQDELNGCFLGCDTAQPQCDCASCQILKLTRDRYGWVLPIFWQRALCAFIVVSSQQRLQKDNASWSEITELSGRIGIAISAQAREEQLLLQAQYDNLTGLPNRILLQDRMKQAIESSLRSGDKFWVIFLDLDRFKNINDTMGHKAGDDLLVQISKELQSVIRDADTVARFGGDEFVIILQGHIEDNTRMGILRRMMQTVEAPMRLEGNEVVVTCSVGVSVFPSDGQNAEALLRNADIAMYRAKELGKNNFQFFTQDMNDKVTDRLRLESYLRKAIEQNEMALYYQPKVSLHTKQIVGFEALIRWTNPKLGTMSPLQFIPLAEETGLIVPIGEWAIRTACKQAKAWQDAGYGQHLMAVNLSVRQFMQKNLVGSIASILKETNLDSQYLELELTESLIINDVEQAISSLKAIKALGVKLSIDDFGTGYSSLSYLNRLPLDALKIDKAFTDGILLSSDDAPIVASIIALGKNLKFKVVAEGVETPEQLAYLTQHGCDEIQGFYFSKPLTAKAVEDTLKHGKTLA
jgi:diguanylate cyclase (GGDEF)-like protein